MCSIRKYSWGDALSHFTLACEDQQVSNTHDHTQITLLDKRATCIKGLIWPSQLELAFFSEKVVADVHACHIALHFGVKAKENQDKVPTLYWLSKLHKNL